MCVCVCLASDGVRERIHVQAGGHVQGHRPQPRSHDDVLAPPQDQAGRPHRVQAGQEQGDGPTRPGNFVWTAAAPATGSALMVRRTGFADANCGGTFEAETHASKQGMPQTTMPA